jgi:surface carbohydrate biosynthesis protein
MEQSIKRIVIILNHADRERRNINKLKKAINHNNPSIEVHILPYRDKSFVFKVLEISPQVIMTFPFTAATTSRAFYLLKYLLNCVLVSFRAEGIMNLESEIQRKAFTGFEKYGVNLVDYEIFWGPGMARTIGNMLLEQSKISSLDRINWFGSPIVEDYVKPSYEGSCSLPDHISKKISQYSKERIVLIATGFLFAEYTDKNILVAGDIVDRSSVTFQQDFEEAQNAVQLCRRFREMWIDVIIRNALKYSNLLFVVKTHPQEIVVYRNKNVAPYEIFNKYNNILLINETIPFRSLINESSLLFHYGSTTSIEAYLSQVPSVFVDSKQLDLKGNKLLFTADIGIPSTISADISEVSSIISKHHEYPIPFELNDETERKLNEFFGYKRGGEYDPSNRIAKFLISLFNEKGQLIPYDDIYLARAIHTDWPGKKLINDLMTKGFSIIERIANNNI